MQQSLGSASQASHASPPAEGQAASKRPAQSLQGQGYEEQLERATPSPESFDLQRAAQANDTLGLDEAQWAELRAVLGLPPTAGAQQTARALREWQAGQPGLQATGELDPASQAALQRSAKGDPRAQAARGNAGPAAPLPHRAAIQAAFGKHDVGDLRAHTGPEAAAGAQDLGAEAYAQGDDIAFSGPPDLATAAHEAAHAVLQGQGKSPAGGEGSPGDAFEQHADAVAARVVAGRSAEDLLDTGPQGGAAADAAVQRAPRDKGTERKSEAQITGNDDAEGNHWTGLSFKGKLPDGIGFVLPPPASFLRIDLMGEVKISVERKDSGPDKADGKCNVSATLGAKLLPAGPRTGVAELLDVALEASLSLETEGKASQLERPDPLFEFQGAVKGSAAFTATVADLVDYQKELFSLALLQVEGARFRGHECEELKLGIGSDLLKIGPWLDGLYQAAIDAGYDVSNDALEGLGVHTARQAARENDEELQNATEIHGRVHRGTRQLMAQQPDLSRSCASSIATLQVAQSRVALARQAEQMGLTRTPWVAGPTFSAPAKRRANHERLLAAGLSEEAAQRVADAHFAADSEPTQVLSVDGSATRLLLEPNPLLASRRTFAATLERYELQKLAALGQGMDDREASHLAEAQALSSSESSQLFDGKDKSAERAQEAELTRKERDARVNLARAARQEIYSTLRGNLEAQRKRVAGEKLSKVQRRALEAAISTSVDVTLEDACDRAVEALAHSRSIDSRRLVDEALHIARTALRVDLALDEGVFPADSSLLEGLRIFGEQGARQARAVCDRFLVQVDRHRMQYGDNMRFALR